MSVATLNTKATGVKLTPEEELTFADIVEAGFDPAPNISVDLSGFDPIAPLVKPIEQYIDEANNTVVVAAKVNYDSITWHGPNVEVTYVWPPNYDYKAWIEQTEAEFALQRRMIVDKYLELDYSPLDPLFKRQFIDALRHQGHRQIKGVRHFGEQACAMGIADEVSHGDLQYVSFTRLAADAIIALNDLAEWTFAKIADWVESKL